jgi:hypothetical protein
MSGTQVQKVSVDSVLRALSISAWEIGCADCPVSVLGLSSSPPHAPRNQALEAAAAVLIRNLRRVRRFADIAVLSNGWWCVGEMWMAGPPGSVV